jgi:hypothetical protein
MTIPAEGAMHRPPRREVRVFRSCTGGALLALVCGAACDGSGVSVSGAFGERPLRVDGTVAAWLDGTTYVLDGGVPVLKDKNTDDAVLHILFTEAVFDPTTDFAALTAAERTTLETDVARGDRLLLDVRRGGVLRDGDEVDLVPDDGSLPPEVLPFLQRVLVSFGAPAVGPSDPYPEVAPVLGSDVTAQLVVSSASPVLAGEVVIGAERGDADPTGVLTGEVTVAFEVPLSSERLAECNFDADGAGAVDACNLQPR